MSRACETCDEALPANAPLGMCPGCLLRRTLREEEAGGSDQAGPFQLMALIGEGSYGEVYIGEQTEPLRRDAAVKVLKAEFLEGLVTKRFQAEAQALALLDHPNIARLYEAGTTREGRPYLAIELVPGLPLTMWCDQEELGIDDRIAIFRKICAAMGHAHGRGLVHRDLKPDNILVDPETGEPKVIDFGIARSTSTLLGDGALLTGAQDILGTPAYLSPEQTDGGDAKIDARADVYALGAVLYELLTGRTPLAASGKLPESHFELLRAVRETVPPTPTSINPEVSPAISGVAMKALAKEREERYTTVEEFADALANPPIPTVRFSRRWLLLGLLLPLVALFWRSPEPEPVPVLDGYSAPFDLIEHGHWRSESPDESIAPFRGADQFTWFQFLDADDRELVFAFHGEYEKPTAGQFIVGAKSADLPGARAVPKDSATDKTLMEILRVTYDTWLPPGERERVEAIDWDDPDAADDVTWKKKEFQGSFLTLERWRDHLRAFGAW